MISNILQASTVLQWVCICIMADTFFGFLRSWKQHTFNSSFGINGGIRKIGMLGGLCFLILMDSILTIDLAFAIPKELLSHISIKKIGLSEFFGMLFIIYEGISILKNMMCLELPVPKWLKTCLETFLNRLTKELPNDTGG